jgi:hypothetical protein
MGGQTTQFEHTLFVDSRRGADKPSELKAKFGVGTGVRWRSPVGPVEAANCLWRAARASSACTSARASCLT